MLLLAATGCASTDRVAEPSLESEHVYLPAPPPLRAAPDAPPLASPAEIDKLIAAFAAIEHPHMGLSAIQAGQAFLPVPGASTVSARVLVRDPVEVPAALKRIVELGPDALPALLEHLDDATPTLLDIVHESRIGGMWFANELWGNPISPREQLVLRARPDDWSATAADSWTDSYRIKVGDVCLVAIGQITGRGFSAARYQPSGNTVLNSPTRDPELRREVRSMWHSEDPRQLLLDSLLFDFACRGISNGSSLDGWYIASRLQTAAALRLAWYFPDQSAGLLAERLDGLEVHDCWRKQEAADDGSTQDAFLLREVANGVSTHELVAALTWSKEPKIQAALERIAARTDDPDLLEVLGREP